MSSYARKNSLDITDEKQQNFRKNVRSAVNDSDFNLNGNNNTEDGIKSPLSMPDSNGRRFSGSKSPARNRKSKLIEAMAANFEKKNDNQSVKTSSGRRSATNCDAKITPMIIEPNDDSNNKNDNDNDTKPANEEKKAGSSGRRGKAQRGKRMLRQKRRSTGVVNKEDLEEMEPTVTTEAEENLQKETDVNTQTNEVSPATSCSNERLDDRAPPRDQPVHADEEDINDTPRRRPDHVTTTDMTSQDELFELQTKLDAAEVTITRLRQEIKIMDKELHGLEDENDQLRRDNKMLEDENRTMLRIMKNGQ